MIVKTLRFGEIEIAEKSVVTVEDGLIGFPEYTRYAILVTRGEENNPVVWLQCMDDPDFALPTLDPTFVDPHYAPRLSQQDLEKIGLPPTATPQFLVVMSVPEGKPSDAICNMRAPIIVNVDALRATQVISQDERYSVRQHILEALQLKGAQQPTQ